MKVFQIFSGFCHWDATSLHPTIESTFGRYSPDIVFVETPDFVFEGWGFDATKDGDARFIMPPLPEPSQWTMPDGEFRQWMYDPNSGTFYVADENGTPISEETELDDLIAAIEYLDYKEV